MTQEESEAGPSTSTFLSDLSLSQSHEDSTKSTDTSPAADAHKSTRKSKLKPNSTQTTSVPTAKTTKSKPKSKPIPTPIQAFIDPAIGEEETVHEIYESIAPHFAQTRHKPWPLITTFLNSLPPHSIGLDSGAGNGKYLPTAHAAGHVMIALDRSLGLLGLAKQQEHEGMGAGGMEVVRGDLGCRGWRDGVFDFTISVAAIHHLSTPIRRRQAVQALLPALKHNTQGPYSRFFIYVWAYEQGGMSKRAMGAKAGPAGASQYNEREGEREDREGEEGERIQDVLVPWVLKSKPKSKPKIKSKPRTKSTSNVSASTSTTTEIETEAGTAQQEDDVVDEDKEENKEEEEKVFNRYYHLFIQGELRELVIEAGLEEGCRILPSHSSSSDSSSTTTSTTTTMTTRIEEDQDKSEDEEGNRKRKWLRIRGEGWEADNWWVEAEVGVGDGQ